MTISGVHLMAFSTDAEATRAFLRDTLELDAVDAGGGWLIFALPPAELGVHPTDGPPRHELYLMCDDLDATLDGLAAKGVALARAPASEAFGRIAHLDVPGIGELGLYEPSHPTPR
jgi:catechol 2,3-dioxygenase-like lactoylglutathione lyase family enzyme